MSDGSFPSEKSEVHYNPIPISKNLAVEVEDELLPTKRHSWATINRLSSYMLKYCVFSYLEKRKTDKLVLRVDTARSIQVDYNKTDTVIVDGMVIYSVDNKLLKVESYGDTIEISSTVDITYLREEIDVYIKNNNPLRGKCVHISRDYTGEMLYSFKTPNTLRYDQIIMDETLKKDIYDNVIVNLEELDYNNGIILHGDPGCGKTILCSTLMAIASSKGFTALFTTDSYALGLISEWMQLFLTETFLVIEDLDTIAPDRKESNIPISEFLQFMNGIQERAQKLVVIATTNHLQWLDDAVKNRPVRFNRKYEILPPNSDQTIQLVELYFNKDTADKYGTYFLNKKFTPSHITEIKRTYELELAKLHKLNENLTNEEELLKKCIDIVHSHFSIMSKKTGF